MRLPILMYHRVGPRPRNARRPRMYVSPEQFGAQLAALKSWGYETIAFGDWLAYLAGAGALPRRPIIVTFDDGYASLFDVAFPLLRSNGYRATVFLVSDLIGKTNAWDSDEPQEPLLDAPQIAQMQAAGIAFESHTRTHAPLTTIPIEQARDEMMLSKHALERLLGTRVRVLCYPYGKENAGIRALARDAGYEAAVIARRRMNTTRTDPFRLVRIGVDHRTSVAELRRTLFWLRWLHWA